MFHFQRNLTSCLFFLITVMASPWAGCGRQTQTHLNEAWNHANEPTNIGGKDILRKWGALPLKGEAAQKGWSEDYWASVRGGISYRWQTNEVVYELPSPNSVSNQIFDLQSPAEKYDLLMQRLDFPTVLSERRRTNVLKTQPSFLEYEKDFKIPPWEGLCHGWAPAALNFKEPRKSVSYRVGEGSSVVFYPSDIKALLLYYHQYAGNRREQLTQYVAERCNTDFAELKKKLDDGEITVDQYRKGFNSAECADMNAGSFHLLLANELGIRKQGFIVDITRDKEVWNQPINSFKSTVIEEKAGASEGAAPLTVREIRLHTKMYYSIEVASSRLPTGVVEGSKTYEYVVELNAADEIIGGPWTMDDSDRPDFAWREAPPEFQGHFRRLKNVYKDSIAD